MQSGLIGVQRAEDPPNVAMETELLSGNDVGVFYGRRDTAAIDLKSIPGVVSVRWTHKLPSGGVVRRSSRPTGATSPIATRTPTPRRWTWASGRLRARSSCRAPSHSFAETNATALDDRTRARSTGFPRILELILDRPVVAVSDGSSRGSGSAMVRAPASLSLHRSVPSPMASVPASSRTPGRLSRVLTVTGCLWSPAIGPLALRSLER
jgi:hypothetical protein